jgi:AcrR family transcriptional regulator
MTTAASIFERRESSKREAILAEAAKMFARFGFRKTSIDEIAREAGVGKGTVYLTADSKEELFYQVLYREVRAWQAACARVIDPRVPAAELLVRLYEVATQNMQANTLVRDLFRGDMGRMLPAWEARFEELRKMGQRNIVEVLQIGIRQGCFRVDLDCDRIAAILQDLQLAGWILRPDSMTDEEFAMRGIVGFDLVLRGLETR